MIGNNTAIYAESPSNVYSYNSDVYSYGYAVQANNSAVVIAQNNYWGQYPPDPTDFLATNGANIYYLPGSPSRFTFRLPKISANNVVDKAQSNDPANFSLDQTLLNAAKLVVDGKYDEAIKIYTQEFNSAKQFNNVELKKYLLVQLAECFRASGKNGFRDFLDIEIFQPSKGKLSKNDELYVTALELENLFLLQERSYKKIIDNLNILKTSSTKNKLTNKYSLFNLGYVFTELLYDAVKGKEYFDELKSKYPDDELTWQSKFLLGEVDSAAIADHNTLAKERKNSSAIQVVDDNYILLQNYPNPFNPVTTIYFQLPSDGNVTLKVFDVLGREITTLINGFVTKGSHKVEWDGINFASGIYFYSIAFNKNTLYKKMLLIK